MPHIQSCNMQYVPARSHSTGDDQRSFRSRTYRPTPGLPGGVDEGFYLASDG